MQTHIHTSRAVRDNISRVKRYICCRPSNILWYKRHAHRRQRRYFNQLMGKFVHDPELYFSEGFRGMPRPLTTWDLD